MQHLEPLRDEFTHQKGHACDVASRPAEAADESELNRIASHREQIGMVVVAALAARTEGVVVATITSHLRCTNSAANAGRRSYRLFAHRGSITRFCLHKTSFLQMLT